MQILTDSVAAVNTVITHKTIKNTGLNRTFRDSVNKDRYKANKKHRDLLGLMVGRDRTGCIFQSLIKNWFCPTLQHHIQLAKAYYVEMVLGSDVSHSYGFTYSRREKLGGEGRFVALSPASVTRSTHELKKLGMIEKGIYTGRRVFSRKKADNSLNNLKLQIGEYRPSFKGLLALAKETIQKHSLEKEFTSPYSYGGLDDTRIFATIFGVENFDRLQKEARQMTLSDLDVDVRKALEEEDSHLTSLEQEPTLEANQEAALADLSSESICRSDYITTNVVNNKYTKTSPADEGEEFKNLPSRYGLKETRAPRRHFGGIKSFLSSYEAVKPISLHQNPEKRIEPVVDYATKAPVPNGLPDAFNNTQALANRLGRSLKAKRSWQPDINTQISRNWMEGETLPQRTQVQYTGEARGRYRVLESTQTHEKAPAAPIEIHAIGDTNSKLEMALQRLLNASEGKTASQTSKPCENPVVAQNEQAQDDDDSFIRERFALKRKALGIE